MAPCLPRSRTSTLLVATALASLALLSCGPGGEADGSRAETLVAQANRPGPIAPLREGGFIFGEGETGKVRLVDAGGRLQVDPVARIDVRGGGALLGLAVDIGERIYASWIGPDDHLLVGWVDAASEHVFWMGPAVTGDDVGGQMAFSPNGDLVVGIGDLGAPSLVGDRRAPNGKLLALDPHGKPNQKPEVFSRGWTNPLAFTWDDQGALWVADAPAPGRGHLVRVVGKKRSDRWELAPGAVPSGMAASGTELLLCDSASGELSLYRDGSDPTVLAGDCAAGIATTEAGSVLYSTMGAIKRTDPV